MSRSQTFQGLDLATLQKLKAEYVDLLSAIAVAGQTYSQSGRSFTRANLPEVKDTIAELQTAIDLKQGKAFRQTRASFSRVY